MTVATALVTNAPQGPAQTTPAHADHCLSHLSCERWQEPGAVHVGFDPLAYAFGNDVLPARTAGLMLFKPPRG